MTRRKITTKLGYDILFGRDLSEEIADRIAAPNVFVLTDTNVNRLYGGLINSKTPRFVIESGENSKTMAVAERVLSAMLDSGCNRHTTVVALGGGVVGDLGGFCAAIFMRGTRVVQIPTTLLAQVDSSIGGKTGVNLPDGKNTVGAFFRPSEVLISRDFSRTLPHREFISGMGEIIKTAMLDAEFYDFLSCNFANAFACDDAVLDELVLRAAEFKSSVVDKDECESGLRKILNLGHTLGHALETLGGYAKSHGEYVLNGILLESAVSPLTEPSFRVGAGQLIRQIIEPESTAGRENEIMRICAHDKKNSNSRVSVMVPVRAGEIREVTFGGEELIAALKNIC